MDPALLPLRTISGKENPFYLLSWERFFSRLVGFIVAKWNGGDPAPSVLTDGLNFLLHDSIGHFLFEMIICLCLAGTIAAVYSRVVRKILWVYAV